MEQRKAIIDQQICLFTHILSHNDKLAGVYWEREKAKSHLCFFFGGSSLKKNAFLVLPLLFHVESNTCCEKNR
jgi:hypothetical protein